jgi:hypothetical protein
VRSLWYKHKLESRHLNLSSLNITKTRKHLLIPYYILKWNKVSLKRCYNRGNDPFISNNVQKRPKSNHYLVMTTKFYVFCKKLQKFNVTIFRKRSSKFHDFSSTFRKTKFQFPQFYVFSAKEVQSFTISHKVAKVQRYDFPQKKFKLRISTFK